MELKPGVIGRAKECRRWPLKPIYPGWLAHPCKGKGTEACLAEWCIIKAGTEWTQEHVWMNDSVGRSHHCLGWGGQRCPKTALPVLVWKDCPSVPDLCARLSVLELCLNRFETKLASAIAAGHVHSVARGVYVRARSRGLPHGDTDWLLSASATGSADRALSLLSVSAQPVSLVALARAGCARPSFHEVVARRQVTIFSAHIVAGCRQE